MNSADIDLVATGFILEKTKGVDIEIILELVIKLTNHLDFIYRGLGGSGMRRASFERDGIKGVEISIKEDNTFDVDVRLVWIDPTDCIFSKIPLHNYVGDDVFYGWIRGLITTA